MVSPAAQELADRLPVLDDHNDDLIPLRDIVVTGVETGWSLHFWVRKYDPESEGDWAILQALPSAGVGRKSVVLNETTVRAATAAYVDSRIQAGMPLDEAAKLIDGVYTDAEIADAILQFALYGEVVYG